MEDGGVKKCYEAVLDCHLKLSSVIRMMKWMILLSFMVMGALHAEGWQVKKKEFEALDKKMNTAYQQVKKSVTASEFTKLQENQREWLQYRDRMSNSAASIAQNFTKEKLKDVKLGKSYWSWMASLTETRTTYISSWKGVGKRSEWAGKYIDSRGGTLMMEEIKGRLHFRFVVVRGASGHIGEISGVAEVNSAAARFSDMGVEKNGDAETWIDFKQENGCYRVNVWSLNASFYQGMGGYFDGVYVKVKSGVPPDLYPG